MGYKTTDEKIRQRLEEISRFPDQCFFVAEKGTYVIGWVHAFRTLRVESGPYVEIGGLVVDEEHLGKGAGRGLVEKVMDWAREKGERKVRVRCNTQRHEAHQFYKKFGFIEVKEQKVFDRALG